MFYSVTDDNQQDKRMSLDNSEVPSTAGKVKVSKVKRSSAPLLGSPMTGAVSAKGPMKKLTEETSSPLTGDDGGGRRPGKPCDKAACVRTGLRPRCFAGASQRSVLPALFFCLIFFLIFSLRVMQYTDDMRKY